MQTDIIKRAIYLAMALSIATLCVAATAQHGGGHSGGRGSTGGHTQGGWRGGGPGRGGGGLGWWGWGLGLGLGWDAAVLANPYYYPYPGYAYPYPGYGYPDPQYVSPQGATVGVSPAPPAANASWYYCASARDYYPRVAQCPEGWQEVPVVPPGVAR